MHDAPDTTDYSVIHHCIRVAPHRMVAALADFAEGDREQATAFARYWTGYATEVLAHHTVEDEIFFPQLIQRVPVVAGHLERVEGDHHRLDELMSAAAQAVERLRATPTGPAAADAAAVIDELAGLMDSHLDFEDEDLVPLFGRHFTAAEYEALTQQAMQHLRLREALFTVPFVMHWTDAAGREKLLAEAPLPMRVIYRLTRGAHTRLAERALGRAAAPQAVLR